MHILRKVIIRISFLLANLFTLLLSGLAVKRCEAARRLIPNMIDEANMTKRYDARPRDNQDLELTSL